MSKKIKMYLQVCLYWISFVGPVYDIVFGCIQGIKNAISNAKEEVRQINIKKMKKDFENDN